MAKSVLIAIVVVGLIAEAIAAEGGSGPIRVSEGWEDAILVVGSYSAK